MALLIYEANLQERGFMLKSERAVLEMLRRSISQNGAEIRELALWTSRFLFVEYLYQVAGSSLMSFRSQLIRWGKTAPRRLSRQAKELNQKPVHERLQVPLDKSVVGNTRIHNLEGVLLIDLPTSKKVFAMTRDDLEAARHLMLLQRNAVLAMRFTSIQELPMPYFKALKDLRQVALVWLNRHLKVKGQTAEGMRELARHAHQSSFVMMGHYLLRNPNETGSFPHASQLALTQVGADSDYRGGKDEKLKKLKDQADEQWMSRVDHLGRVNPFDPGFMDHVLDAPRHPVLQYVPWEDSLHESLRKCCDHHDICHLDAVDALKSFHSIPCMRFCPHGLACSFIKKSSKSKAPNLAFLKQFLDFSMAADIEEYCATNGTAPRLECTPGFDVSLTQWGGSDSQSPSQIGGVHGSAKLTHYSGTLPCARLKRTMCPQCPLSGGTTRLRERHCRAGSIPS